MRRSLLAVMCLAGLAGCPDDVPDPIYVLDPVAEDRPYAVGTAWEVQFSAPYSAVDWEHGGLGIESDAPDVLAAEALAAPDDSWSTRARLTARAPGVATLRLTNAGEVLDTRRVRVEAAAGFQLVEARTALTASPVVADPTVLAIAGHEVSLAIEYRGPDGEPMVGNGGTTIDTAAAGLSAAVDATTPETIRLRSDITGPYPLALSVHGVQRHYEYVAVTPDAIADVALRPATGEAGLARYDLLCVDLIATDPAGRRIFGATATWSGPADRDGPLVLAENTDQYCYQYDGKSPATLMTATSGSLSVSLEVHAAEFNPVPAACNAGGARDGSGATLVLVAGAALLARRRRQG